MSKTAGGLLKAETAYFSRTPEFTSGFFFGGVRVAHLISFCVVVLCVLRVVK